jgi:dienelactone hydrolase
MTFSNTSPSRVFRVAAGTLLVSGFLSTDTLALTGTVKTNGGVGLRNAKVSLVSDPTIKGTTDSLGAFTLNTATAIAPAGFSGAVVHQVGALLVRNGRLQFALSSWVRQASLSIVSLDGAQHFQSPRGAWHAGIHELQIPHLAAGLYVVRFTLDEVDVVKSLVLTGSLGQSHAGVSARAPAQASSGTPVLARQADSPLEPIDTLLVIRHGYATTKYPIVSHAQTAVAVVLTVDTVSQLAPIADYSVNGPYTTVVEANVGPGNNYTIIRPETLGANGFKHAPIIYGHGINGQVSTFTTFLHSVASHGFVVIARNVLTGGPNNAGNTSAMNDGLNWILAQDTTPSSIFFRKLATDRASSMGYSVGGTAAVDIGAHPALKTVVSIHGHISKATLHGSLLQTSGTLDNVGLPMQQQTFDSSDVPTFLGTVTGANHGYISSNNGGVQRAAIIAWLRYWIYNDHGGKPYFYGPACVMCSAPWENPQRKYWD